MKKIGKDSFVFDYSRRNAPCRHAKSGEVISFEVGSCFLNLRELEKALRQKKRSPLFGITGPLYIFGATPGKTLRVEILRLRLTSQKGYSVLLPGRGCFGDVIKENHIQSVQIGQKEIRFSKGISLPLAPMVGRIGVAPRRGSPPSHLPGPHGGNLDCKEIQAGATVYLPVFADGGLLALGDIHAAMGDGECGLSGVETDGEVKIRCSVVDRPVIKEPWVVTKQEAMALASAPTVGKAAKKALSYLGDMLQSKLGLNFYEAIMLMSASANVGICQMVNPLVTVKVSIPTSVLKIGQMD